MTRKKKACSADPAFIDFATKCRDKGYEACDLRPHHQLWNVFYVAIACGSGAAFDQMFGQYDTSVRRFRRKLDMHTWGGWCDGSPDDMLSRLPDAAHLNLPTFEESVRHKEKHDSASS